MKTRAVLSIFVLLLVLPAAIGADDTDLYAKLGIMRLEPRKADDFEVLSLEGETVRLSDMLGKVVFLNFWATNCGPCVMEVGEIDRLFDRLGGEDFTVMAVDLGEDRRRVTRFMDREGIDFPVFLDEDASTARQYGIRGIPTTFIVDPEGFIVAGAIGPRDWAGDDSVALMQSLMD